MSAQLRCMCSRCTIRGLMGPAVITTLGVLFLLSELLHGSFSFGRTFPILLIVIGGILLASAVAPMDGHINISTPPGPPVAPAPPAPPPNYPNSQPGQGQ
jgi:hypothetical protein